MPNKSTAVELKNLTSEEIQPFLNSLRDEDDLSELRYLGLLPTAKFVTAAGIDKEVAGIGGITEMRGPILMRFINIPILFISVKPHFQRRGVGNKILQNVITFTRERYSCLTLTTYKTEEYRPAVNLYLKNGFKIYSSRVGVQYYMCLPFGKRAEIVCRFLSLFYIFDISCYLPVVHALSRLRSQLPQFLRKSSRQKQHKV